MKNPEKYLIFKFKHRYGTIPGIPDAVTYPTQPASVFYEAMLFPLSSWPETEQFGRLIGVYSFNFKAPKYIHYLIFKDNPLIEEIKTIIPKEAIFLKTLRWRDDLFSGYMKNIKERDKKWGSHEACKKNF